MRDHTVTYKGQEYRLKSLGKALTPYGYHEDYLSIELDKGHFFEEGFLDRLRDEFLGDYITFVDIGANIGNHSVFARDVLGAKHIICFEPVAAQREVLEANLPGATVYPYGLSDAPGTMGVELNVMRDGTTGGILANAGGSRLTEGNAVEVRTLDSFGLAAEGQSVWKIDVEGMEAKVLKGAVETIKRLQPVIYTECNDLANLMACMEVLRPLGYSLTWIEDHGNPMAEWSPPND